MKRIIYYKKKTKRVGMLAENKIQVDRSIWAEKEMNLTKKQLGDIANAEKILYKNGKLKITPRIDNKAEKQKLKEELEKAESISKIKEIIKKLL